jgi:hypothetical protein
MDAGLQVLNLELDRDKWLNIVAALYWGKGPSYQLGGPQSYFGPFGKQKNLLHLLG